MRRTPFGRSTPDPKRSNIFIDSCAFDPIHEPETSAANQLKSLSDGGKLILLIAHSNVKELEHPNVPFAVKQEAQGRVRSLKVSLTPKETALMEKILETLAGNGKPENMVQDAEHIFEAQKYGSFFITVDKGILRKAEALRVLCGITILLPSEFLVLLQNYA